MISGSTPATRTGAPTHDAPPVTVHVAADGETKVAADASPGALLPAARPAARAEGTAGAAAGQDLKLLERAIRQLCERDDGISKIFVGEAHNEPGNVERLTRAIEGGLYAKRGPVTVYREMGFLPAEAAGAARAEAVLGSPVPAHRAIALERIRDGLGSEQDSAAALAQYAKIGGRKDVAFKLMNWFDPQRRDMSRFIQDRNFAIASLGEAHALNDVVAGQKNLNTVTWLGPCHVDKTPAGKHSNVGNLPPPLRGANLAREAQVDAFNGFARALRDHGPAMFIGSGAMWSHRDLQDVVMQPEARPLAPAELRERFIAHYTSLDCAVIELPAAQGVEGGPGGSEELPAPAGTLDRQEPRADPGARMNTAAFLLLYRDMCRDLGVPAVPLGTGEDGSMAFHMTRRCVLANVLYFPVSCPAHAFIVFDFGPIPFADPRCAEVLLALLDLNFLVPHANPPALARSPATGEIVLRSVLPLEGATSGELLAQIDQGVALALQWREDYFLTRAPREGAEAAGLAPFGRLA